MRPAALYRPRAGRACPGELAQINRGMTVGLTCSGRKIRGLVLPQQKTLISFKPLAPHSTSCYNPFTKSNKI
ncbi:hypothetical protein LMG27177_03277 [Paraburkholderia fynbosensis]|uniref:Uncharacterized protein n=1 Tax=Paraburkholderia fynbosensis TaxID=1200993 RepID=A0A6J5G3S3_9BURK|nr:hypothetical protein LMG27177_03277 [Paraburkholderia fynbosensis]